MAGLINLQYSVNLHKLKFKVPAKTSRNIFDEKPHWIVKLWSESNPKIIGIGEAAPLEFLSIDFDDNLGDVIENRLDQLVDGEDFEALDFDEIPSVKFAIESALLDLKNGGQQIYYPTNFLTGQPIPINGLVWMNELDKMLDEAYEKVNSGYDCIKFKIGSHDFDAECRFLETFRNSVLGKNIVIRLDANGAFDADEALGKMKELRRFNIHSIEQPIMAEQWDEMAKICRDSKIDIALDEELIGINSFDRIELLELIKPQFLILKPTMLGGFHNCDIWVNLANKYKIGWWVTSALESNIGLNAIAQWVAKYPPYAHQGLGTGLLFQNNFTPKSRIEKGHLFYSA